MTVSALSHYRGGALDDVAPIARTLKAAYQAHGIGYRLSRYRSGPNAGDWCVVVTYADEDAYTAAQAAIARDPACQKAFTDIAAFAKRISREIVEDIDL